MKRFILTAAIAAAIGLPVMAIAQTTSVTGSIVCRPVKVNETPNATIQNTHVLCRAVDATKVRTAMAAVMAGMTAQQKAKARFAMTVLMDELQLEPRYPGYDGNPND
jgi:hypothetical protein